MQMYLEPEGYDIAFVCRMLARERGQMLGLSMIAVSTTRLEPVVAWCWTQTSKCFSIYSWTRTLRPLANPEIANKLPPTLLLKIMPMYVWKFVNILSFLTITYVYRITIYGWTTTWRSLRKWSKGAMIVSMIWKKIKQTIFILSY